MPRPHLFLTCYIEYRYAGNGVISYDYYKVTDWEKVGNYVKDAVGVVIIAGITYAVVQIGWTIAPVLFPLGSKTLHALAGG
ncbi:MAG: hypothetical protein GX066_07450 [Clostridiaceae bacterium]|nr:hypothetical protein [Clostridiaceae bacterium]